MPRRAIPFLVTSLVLFVVALAFLLLPVSTHQEYNGEYLANGQTSTSCGPAILQAFKTAGDQDDSRDYTLDCAAKGRGRLGPAALLLIFALPSGIAAAAVYAAGEQPVSDLEAKVTAAMR